MQSEKTAAAKKPSVTPLTNALRRPAPAPRRDAVPTLVLHTEPPRPPQPSPPPSSPGKLQLLPPMRHARRARLEVLRAMRHRDQTDGRRDRLVRVMAAPVVETHSLAKTFGVAPVLRDVQLRLLQGAGAFLVGGNGAGKSTLLRILAGLTHRAVAMRWSSGRTRAGSRRATGAVSA